MKIITSLNEAITFCRPFLSTSIKQSETALQNTLDYVFTLLHHSCYLLCSDGTKSTLVKLESTTTAPYLVPIFEKELASLPDNKTINKRQQIVIRNFITDKNTSKIADDIRVLQCIVKKIQKKTTSSKEYEDFFRGIVLPQGVFLMNLTDAVLLRKDRCSPFPIYRENGRPTTNVVQEPLLPIFSISGNKLFDDYIIPNYDDITYVLKKATYDIGTFTTNWQDKTIAKAVFRGGPSGCGYTAKTNQRIQLATMQHPDLDVGIVGEKNTIDSNSIRFDPVYGLGTMNTGIPTKQRLTYQEQSQYKYIIHVDGNVNAYRLLSIMATGSLVLRVKSNYVSWADHMLKEGEHYIEVKDDLSDLLEKIQWAKEHDNECQIIAKKASELAKNILLHPDVVKKEFRQIVEKSLKEPTSPDFPPPAKRVSTSPDFLPPAKRVSTSPEFPPPAKKVSTSPEFPPPNQSNDDFYIKGENDKRCKKGFIQDKKDKTRCNKAKSKEPPMVEQPIIVEQPIVEQANNDDFYIKGEKEKRCKKGYSQDKKDKTRCNKEKEKILNLNKEVVLDKAIVPVPDPFKESDDFYIKGEKEKRCKKGYIQDKKDKTKCNKDKKTLKNNEQPSSLTLKKKSPSPGPGLVNNFWPNENKENFYIKGEKEKRCKKGYVQDKKDKTKCNKETKKTIKKISPSPMINVVNKLYQGREKCNTIREKIRKTYKQKKLPV